MVKPTRTGRISLAEQKRLNQSAMDFYADIAGKPRVERFAPEKRAAPTHDPANGKLEDEVKTEVFRVLRLHPKVMWFARMNSGEFIADGRHIKAYAWYAEDVKAKSSGIHDFIGMTMAGRFFSIECKRERGGVVSADQQKFFDTVEAGGGACAIVRSAQEALDFLEHKL